MFDLLRLTGGRTLQGTVPISGFKHALVPMMAASILGEDSITISNVPEIEDMRILSQIIRLMGGVAEFDRGELNLNTRNLHSTPIPATLTHKVHGSLYLVPSLLARFGQVQIGLTGGCQIGDGEGGRRPTAHVLAVLERFGATFIPSADEIVGRCSRLTACDVDIHDFAAEVGEGASGPLVSGATKTAILAAATAAGTSTIRHPYRKIDVIELVDLLRAGGVPIHRIGDTLVVEGRDRLGPAARQLPSDLIEVVTYIAGSIYLKGDICLDIINPVQVMAGLDAECRLLEAMGVELSIDGSFLRASASGPLRPQSVTVSSTGIFSDSQPFFTLLLTLASGPSRIEDRVWPSRFDYAEQCARLGARVRCERGMVDIQPGRAWRAGLNVHASDVRGAAVLALAALGVSGTTVLSGADHLGRGYSDFIGTLTSLGADIAVG
jgi:UDP-N-acetylglucosamine 1-carboxyvinyltransferase